MLLFSMIPGFIANYIDKDKYRHLYFFKGIDDNDKKIYNNIDLSEYKEEYDYIENIDGSIDYKFFNRNIVKITCKLVKQDNTYDIVVLNYK